MQLPVFLLLQVKPSAAMTACGFCQQIAALAQGYGAVAVATYDVEWMLETGNTPQYFKVLSFPDRQAIQALFNDPAYQALQPEQDGEPGIRHYVVSENIHAPQS